MPCVSLAEDLLSVVDGRRRGRRTGQTLQVVRSAFPLAGLRQRSQPTTGGATSRRLASYNRQRRSRTRWFHLPIAGRAVPHDVVLMGPPLLVDAAPHARSKAACRRKTLPDINKKKTQQPKKEKKTRNVHTETRNKESIQQQAKQKKTRPSTHFYGTQPESV